MWGQEVVFRTHESQRGCDQLHWLGDLEQVSSHPGAPAHSTVKWRSKIFGLESLGGLRSPDRTISLFSGLTSLGIWDTHFSFLHLSAAAPKQSSLLFLLCRHPLLWPAGSKQLPAPIRSPPTCPLVQLHQSQSNGWFLQHLSWLKA